MKKHLIRIWGNIGDAVCAEPWVRAFVAKYPSDSIAVQSMAPTLFKNYPGIAEVYHLDEAINRKDFDRYWFAHPDHHSHINDYFFGKYPLPAADRIPRLTADADISEIRFPKHTKLLAVAVAPSNPIRMWPFERWSELCRRLAERFAVVQLGCGEPPLPTVQRSLVNATDLRQTAAVLRRCRLLVTIDSGLCHLAAAVGTPAITLFGPVDPAIRSHGSLTIPVVAGTCRHCWPAYKSIKKCPLGHHRCMRSITVDQVVQAVISATPIKTVQAVISATHAKT